MTDHIIGSFNGPAGNERTNEDGDVPCIMIADFHPTSLSGAQAAGEGRSGRSEDAWAGHRWCCTAPPAKRDADVLQPEDRRGGGRGDSWRTADKPNNDANSAEKVKTEGGEGMWSSLCTLGPRCLRSTETRHLREEEMLRKGREGGKNSNTDR